MSINSKKFKNLLKKKTLLIGEIGQAHEGSLNLAHSYIDLCADLGLDAIKFQTHIADKESTLDEPFRVKFSHTDKTRYDYWKRMEFSQNEWKGIFNHAKKRKILFLSTAFSIEAFDLLNKFDVCAWKVASGEISNINLINKMIKTKKTIILSTGLATFKEIEKLLSYLKRKKADFILLQCTSNYPVKMQNVGLNVMHEFKEKYKCKVGLSDHTGTIYPAIYSICNKFNLIEFHVTFDKKMFGPDSSSSLDVGQISQLQNFSHNISYLLDNPVHKDKVSKKAKKYKKIFGKSLALVKDLPKSHRLKKSDLTMKKPGSGIPENKLNHLVGRRLSKNVSKKYLLKYSDLQ